MNEIIHATVTQQNKNNFAVGTRLTGTLARYADGEYLQVRTANDAPLTGFLTEKLENLKVNRTERVGAVRVGDIFEMSWGYDQTNVNYFQVTRLTYKGAYVREIGAKSVPGTQGFMCEHVKPHKDNFLTRSQWCCPRGKQSYEDANPETFRRIDTDSQGQPSFNFRGRYFARRVRPDESTYSSWYH